MADGPPISQHINSLMAALVAFKQEVNPNEDDRPRANELKATIDRLKAALDQLKRLVDQLGSATTRSRALTEIETLVAIDSAVSLDVFFRAVGSAVINAQRALDQRFEEDLRLSPASGRISPVQYSIPSVHAEMKVGFSQVSNRGVNLLVFTNSQQKQNYSESTISFDIAAAPPPPNMARLDRPVVSPSEAGGSDVTPLEATDVLLEPLPSDVELESVGVLPPTPSLTFPLEGDTRDAALARLEEALSGSNRAQLKAVREHVVIVSSGGESGSQPMLLYLCPGVERAKAARARRAFRCYLAGVDVSGSLTLRPLRRPDVATVDSRAYSGSALLVPAPPLSARDRSVVPAVLGGVGSALMHLLNAANAFLPAPDAAIVDEINTHLHEVPALIEGEPWAVFPVRAERRVKVQE